jgi:copper chaperone CopZ
MKLSFILIAIAFSLATKAQVTKVYLKASGLTCSMCSNSINKALKTLDFVEAIEADIKTYTFELSFKANSHVDFDKIKKKVEDAGFSVSGFTAFVNFSNVQVIENKPVTTGGYSFVFANLKEPVLNGIKAVKILNKGFVSQKEYKQISSPAFAPGIYHATI